MVDTGVYGGNEWFIVIKRVEYGYLDAFLE